MSTSSKIARTTKNLVINQFMTREAINSASFQPTKVQNETNATPEKMSVRLHDESVHLKFGFPTKNKTVNEENTGDSTAKNENDRKSTYSEFNTITN